MLEKLFSLENLLIIAPIVTGLFFIAAVLRSKSIETNDSDEDFWEDDDFVD